MGTYECIWCSLVFLSISVSIFSFSPCLQNLCFILPQFLYQFFCGYSQQVSMSWGPLRFKDVLNMKGGSVPWIHSVPSHPPECQTLSLRLPLPHCPWDVWALIDLFIYWLSLHSTVKITQTPCSATMKIVCGYYVIMVAVTLLLNTMS